MLAQYYLEEVAKKPVTDTDFAGEDVRYSAEFESLENELAKAGSLHQTSTTDWQKIREGSEALLARSSKDLRAAVWLTWSLFQRESYVGLHAGLGALTYLCTHHWDQLHPAKARTRVAAFNWLQPRLEQALAESDVQADPELFRKVAADLKALDTQLAAKLADDAPLLRPLCRRMETMLARASEPTPENATKVEQPKVVSLVPSTTSSSPEQVDNSKDAQRTLRTLQDQSRALCSWWQQQKAGDYRAIKLARTLLWLPIDAAPEHNAEHMTALRGLPADRLANYADRLNQGQHTELLNDLEASITRAPFWLDGQHLAWRCLQAINAEQAMYEIEVQLAMLLKRLPVLEGLRFHDGVPFASEETRAWISGHVMPHIQAAPAAAHTAQATGPDKPWDEGLISAQAALRKDGLKAAVQMMKHGMAQAKGGREKLFWQLAQARLCFHARKYDLARIQLETLYQLLQQNGLEDWEPDLALQVLSLLHNCCELLPQSQALRERKDEIYRRLCHLDLEVVLDQALGP